MKMFSSIFAAGIRSVSTLFANRCQLYFAFSIYYIGIFSLYLILKNIFNRRTALLNALLLGAYGWYLFLQDGIILMAWVWRTCC